MNRLSIQTALGITLLSLVGIKAGAVPTLYPTELTRLSHIKNNTNSNVIADDVDPNRFYVMPPNKAVAEVQGLHTLNMNVGFCEELKNIQTYSRDLTSRVAALSKKQFDSLQELKKYQDRLEKAKLEEADFVVAKDLRDIKNLDEQIEKSEERLSALYEIINTCTQNCEAPNAEADELYQEKNKLVKQRRELMKARVADVKAYDRKRQKVQAALENLEQFQESHTKLIDVVLKTKEQLRSLYSSYGKMEGARAAFSFQSKWDEYVTMLNKDNPGTRFEPIQTANATVFASLLDIKSIPQDSAILAFEMPGEQVNGAIKLSSFPSDLSANIVLSLLGACPVLHPEYFPETEATDTKNMKYGLTVSYEYPSNFKLKVTVKYNLYRMYEKIVKSGRRGGFFSSRSTSSVEERNFFQDSFQVDWKTQDPANSVTEEERVEIENDIKKELLLRIANMALPFSPDRQGIIAAAEPPQRGAVVVGDSLLKYSGGNSYAVAAGMILKGLDSIFGSSSSQASYSSIHNIESVQTWSRDEVKLKPWITTYNPENSNKEQYETVNP